ncbi:MAG: hypothetical protein U1E26_02575 [Coriobacteriia bacterium]|nr:hypothetical protein [Coriobacteriia bacterium]
MHDTKRATSGVSRRAFITGAGVMLGAVVAPAVIRTTEASAAAPKALPWAYTPQDPDKLARRAYEVFFQSGCSEATAWPLIEALAADTSNPDRELWASIPKNVFAYGGAGLNAWGTVCGTLNGSSAILSMCGGPATIIDANMRYYAETPLPTNRIDNAYRSGWRPVSGPAPKMNAPTTTGHTQLCHASISVWTTMTGTTFSSAERKDRCAKASHDLMRNTVVLLNRWAAGEVIPALVLSDAEKACSPCHSGNAKGRMDCDSCHDETATSDGSATLDGHSVTAW